jgi:protein-S-isoprenylcysteine O-methyltransferase Ste14
VTLPRLGARGEGWVVLQFALLGLLALVTWLAPGGWPAPVRWAGTVLMGLGLLVLALGFKDLGESLDARPAPLQRGSLRDRGVYSWVRHPIYGGLVLAAFGWALRSNPWALLPAAALAVELDLKRRVEEDFLAARYEGYADYRARVRRVFIPGVW